jgi:hypothetical protein
MADQLAPADVRRRKSSVGAVELQGPGGVVRTVNLEDMSEADRALAAEFGYKPVGAIKTDPRSWTKERGSNASRTGLQARVWLSVDILVCRQYQWSLLDCGNDLLVSFVCWRERFSRLVLAHLRSWLYVHRCKWSKRTSIS